MADLGQHERHLDVPEALISSARGKSASQVWGDMLNKASKELRMLLFQICAGLCRQCAADKLRQHATWLLRQGV